ncbi:sensor histidine kinase [Aestuariimicrobium ganziense]|uniref:sensor histidine kinase n=1 Tax=Aestuariimicrobium ganziense TaxID=2773677 RepID=UPI00194476D0|nr:histidine kinase [Aestuariimicrobium ganziense]
MLTLVGVALLLDSTTRMVVDLVRGVTDSWLAHVVRVTSILVMVGAVWRPMLALAMWLLMAPFSGYQSMSVLAWLVLAARITATGRIWQVVVVVVSGFVYEVWFRVTEYDYSVTSAAITTTVMIAMVVVFGATARYFIRQRLANTELAVALEVESARLREAEHHQLARELHDGLAHELSIITLQAMAAQSGAPGAQRQALAEVVAASANAMAELRGLVTLLRDDGASPWLDTSAPTELAQRMASTLAGRDLDLQVAVDPIADTTTGHVRQTLLRVLKETATNVLRHAPAGSTATMTVDDDGHQVRVVVENQTTPGGSRSPLSTGWGLLGLRERILLIGGDFGAGEVDGRWRVEVTIPLETPSAPLAQDAPDEGRNL